MTTSDTSTKESAGTAVGCPYCGDSVAELDLPLGDHIHNEHRKEQTKIGKWGDGS